MAEWITNLNNPYINIDIDLKWKRNSKETEQSYWPSNKKSIRGLKTSYRIIKKINDIIRRVYHISQRDLQATFLASGF